MRKYRFSSRQKNKERIIRLVDNIGFIFAKEAEINFEKIHSVCVIQLAHTGDFILTLPFLYVLSKYTDWKINVAVNSVNSLIAKSCSFIDEVYVADAPFFDRTGKANYIEFIKSLSKIDCDVGFDLRGDFRNIFFFKFFSNLTCFAGFDAGGGGFLLDYRLPYPFGKHITETGAAFLKFCGLNKDIMSEWRPDLIPAKKNDFMHEPPYLAVHVGTGTPARKWPVKYFRELVKKISKEIPVVVMGTEKDFDEAGPAGFESLPRVKVTAGKVNLLEAIEIVKNAALFLGLESAFAHVAGLVGTRGIVLWSGATEISQWGPLQIKPNQIKLLRNKVYCSPPGGCGRLTCKNNLCMLNFSVDRVYDEILKLLP